MRIRALNLRNFRTLESVDLEFPSTYAAICGPNDSGKTNVVRAMRLLMKEDTGIPFRFDKDDQVSLKDDYPKWKDTKPEDRLIQLAISLIIDKDRDVGLYKAIKDILKLDNNSQELIIEVEAKYTADLAEPQVVVRCGEREFTGLEAQETLKRLQSSKCFLAHNSTQIAPLSLVRGPFEGYLRELSAEYSSRVESMKNVVTRGFAKIAKTHQTDLELLLGRLETKYKVNLSTPAFDFGYLPFSVTLCQRNMKVPLEDWGSGTKNRTQILLTLFYAKQIADSEVSASKTTPIIIVEEPESFLHSAAQAEFGRVLQDLSEEFQVQVIVTTHSPYLLSLDSPGSNILLKRRIRYRQAVDTVRVDTSGDHWMEPFGLALGLESAEFTPWKKLLLAKSDAILLVEGEIDKEYFEMLRQPAHGANRLDFDGEIVPYEGTGALRNTVLLRFMKNRCNRLFVTYDLDCERTVESTLKSLGFEKRNQYMPVGINAPGKKDIEGLLPDSVKQAVYQREPDLLEASRSGTKDEKASANSNLKRLFLEEFKDNAEAGEEFFGKIYPLVKIINKALG